jgi:mannan polymerase II complex ANP1 subunit
MEAERVAHEQEEKERAERAEKIKEQFADPNGQWEKDKADIQNEAIKAKASEEKAAKEKVAGQKPVDGDAKQAVAGPAKPPEKAQEGGSKGKKQVIRTHIPLVTFILTTGRIQKHNEAF